MFVLRAEFEQVEARLLQAEKELQMQAQKMQELQANLEMLQSTKPAQPAMQPAKPSVFQRNFTTTAARERSRTPTVPSVKAASGPRQAPIVAGKPVLSGEASSLVEEFAGQNGLDEKCVEALLAQTPQVQNHVILQGPAEGRNPSAMVMSRIWKAQRELPDLAAQTELQAQVETFIVENSLDEQCSEALRSQSTECQVAVLGQGPASGRNASAMVTGRMAKFQKGII